MERLPMRKIKDVLRLRAAGYSARRIADSLGLGRTSARNYLERAEKAGLSWPDVADLDEDALEHRLFGREARPEGHRFVEPDWAEVNQELKRPGATLLLLWDEYRARHPGDGYAYSAYCQHYRAWVKRLSPSMRQRHAAGEKMFVDYSGVRMEGDRSRYRHASSRRVVRRGFGRVELYLCRGKLEPDATGLDRRACPRVRVLRRRAGLDRVGQS